MQGRDSHSSWMERALTLAHRAQGRTSPNPPVGAVIVRDGRIVGEGWTQPPGGPHAEVAALRAAGPEARGSDLYVTLEPCTFWGRTPPCTDAIVQAGIRRVFFAAYDPDQRIGEGATAVLARAGIEARYCPEYAACAEELIAPFRCWTRHRRPLVIAKYAMTLDGRVATVTGDSRWISSSAARRRVHELRDCVDAIIVGVGTVLADDPLLTTRLEDHWRPVQHPLRVIVDSRGRMPLTARVLDPGLPGRTLVATVRPDSHWHAALVARGIDVLVFDPGPDGRVPLPSLLRALGERGYTSALVEGGSTLLGALAQERLIDRIWAFIAPKIVGGSAAPGPVGGPGALRMADAQHWEFFATERIGDDLLVIARPRSAPANDDGDSAEATSCL
ncbi:MAG: bifunctional diaminohydroxyphosphoribosylaminopyrimidine deaminase/5-amino-6-(5-phosphoribosylamino)uracil reductase RibD [Roseiflexus sp.]|nr:bifunctional diaminohydroxyphosphoribosylaminopyrimidine deaminase/5-amino-6-(5-phosphoribosylamino)uracil reductase RibD [Roseiflexus sp.]MCS7290709.1 bifunctional diaminohydroxyphosphoribosylaminopyrimidine deaminase/5-amino-6-(5-phosphoribosylamino)uracil reductase RibD [Roseiflexus sp.]MDW8232689.1 bifunctional diaminohydroxyphosphoribosylaminopyrimidine deaminase/5-amino-6-(5-phosphoribosylamino)uracil reductase RibD [Roseiflexaceae bacterium]